MSRCVSPGPVCHSVITLRKATITILQVCFQHQNPVYLEKPKYYQEETHYNNYFLWQWEILLPMPHFHEKFIQTNLKQAVFLIVTTPTTKTYQVSDITKVSSSSAKQKFIWIFSNFYNLTKKTDFKKHVDLWQNYFVYLPTHLSRVSQIRL